MRDTGLEESRMYPFYLGLCSPSNLPNKGENDKPLPPAALSYSLSSYSLRALEEICQEQHKEREDCDYQRVKWRWFAGLCVSWHPVKASMSLRCCSIMKSNGPAERWLVGQEGHRVTAQMSHSSNQCRQESAFVPNHLGWPWASGEGLRSSNLAEAGVIL